VIVVDAGALIARVDERDALHEGAEAALLAAADQPRGCRPLTLAEALARRDRLEEAHIALEAVSLEVIALCVDAPTRLALLRVDTGVRLPDCCVSWPRRMRMRRRACRSMASWCANPLARISRATATD
jgi:predicted nucleic acid-binding protein